MPCGRHSRPATGSIQRRASPWGIFLLAISPEAAEGMQTMKRAAIRRASCRRDQLSEVFASGHRAQSRLSPDQQTSLFPVGRIKSTYPPGELQSSTVAVIPEADICNFGYY